MRQEELSGTGVLTLPAEISVHCIEELANSLGIKLAEMPEIVVDAAEVEHIDACGLQLLIAFAKEASIKGKPFMLVNAGGYLERILTLTGAAKVLSVRKEVQG